MKLEFGTLTAANIAYLLKEPYQSGAPAPCFLAEWTANLNDLRRAGQPIADFAATTLLKGCFDGIREFTKCWLQLMQTFPLVADRTVPRHCAAIIIFARDALPLLMAHSAIGMSTVTDQSVKMELMQQKMDRLEIALAAQVAQQAPPSRSDRKRGTTTAVGAVSKSTKTSSGVSRFAARPFCWSHGPCKHKGIDCTQPSTDHKTQATWNNQMGSQWREFFRSRGYSIE